LRKTEIVGSQRKARSVVPMVVAVDVVGLTKRYGDLVALQSMSCKIEQGEIFGLIGPNGAGKTTALRIIGTLITPTEGTALVFGEDVVKSAAKVRGMISYLPEEAGPYRNLSGWEYLRFMASFYSQKRGEVEQLSEEGGRISGLEERLKDRVKGYSKGMSRRLLLARALMVKPRLAVLDEPTAGLDVVHAVHIRRTIREYAEKLGTTILLSSHNMLEVEFLCDRVALMERGIILGLGTPQQLKDKYGAKNLEEAFMEAVKSV